MTFTEASTVDNLVCDLPCAGIAHHAAVVGGPARTSGKHWHCLPRQPQEVFVEAWNRAALIRLNPKIVADPDWAGKGLDVMKGDGNA